MYSPEHFAETRTAELMKLIEQYPLGVLVTHGAAGLDANHLPFEVDSTHPSGGRLLAHVARSNPVWQEARDGQQVLVIFRGGDTYISPNWYPSKHEFHRQVPTWNYRVVHVHGALRIRDDEKFVRGVVARLTRRHEAATGDPKPWKMADSEPDYINTMIASIVGIEIEVARIEGKFKLSQNKEERDRLQASNEVRRHGNPDIADAMFPAQDG